MGITIDWDNTEKSTLYVHYGNGWTIGDYIAAVDQTTKLLNSVQHQVDIIVDFQDDITVPRNLSLVRRYANKKRPANLRTRVVLTRDVPTRALLEKYWQLDFTSDPGLASAPSLDRARALLAEQQTEHAPRPH